MREDETGETGNKDSWWWCFCVVLFVLLFFCVVCSFLLSPARQERDEKRMRYMNEGENFVLTDEHTKNTHKKKHTFEEEVVKTKQNETTQHNTHKEKKKRERFPCTAQKRTRRGRRWRTGGGRWRNRLKRRCRKAWIR